MAKIARRSATIAALADAYTALEQRVFDLERAAGAAKAPTPATGPAKKAAPRAASK